MADRPVWLQVFSWRGLKGRLKARTLRSFAQSGRISLAEGRFLSALVREACAHPGPLVEVGVLFGHSTTVIALAKEEGRELIAVDDFRFNPCALLPEQHRALTRSVLAEAARGHNVRLVERDKAAFYREYAGPAPALAFFDAEHSYEETRADLAWARAARARIVAGHDYGPACPGVVRAAQEIFGRPPDRLCGTLFAYLT